MDLTERESETGEKLHVVGKDDSVEQMKCGINRRRVKKSHEWNCGCPYSK